MNGLQYRVAWAWIFKGSLGNFNIQSRVSGVGRYRAETVYIVRVKM